MKYLIYVIAIVICSEALATGKRPSVPTDSVDVTTEIHADLDAKAISDADANAASHSDADSHSTSSAKGGDSDAHAASDATGGGGGASSITDLSSYSYQYEEAAESAAILFGQVCQETTNIQGVKFGIGAQHQSLFCMRMTLGMAKMTAAMTIECEGRSDVGKGSPIPTPDPSTCDVLRYRLFNEAIDQWDAAAALLDGDKPGWLKKLKDWVW